MSPVEIIKELDRFKITKQLLHEMTRLYSTFTVFLLQLEMLNCECVYFTA